MRRRIIALVFAAAVAAGIGVPIATSAAAGTTASAPHFYYNG